jgi:hypothetical protein
MKSFKSQTINGGKTIILDHLDEAIQTGREKVAAIVARYAHIDPKAKINVGSFNRDKETRKEVKMNMETYLKKWKATQQNYATCEEAITKGDPAAKERISRMVEDLHDLSLDLAPSLKANYAGFQRSEDGFSVNPELLAAGEEQCCIKRKEGGENIKQGTGDGAYRIIINTDVAWWGNPEDNAALMGALVVMLQQFKPVQVWIQQGWLGEHPGDGVTLFKLDYSGAFDPTALTFWCGHQFKDGVFSYLVNLGLGRENNKTSVPAEIEADLYLRGDWMSLMGIKESNFVNMLHTDKMDIMAKWIADTAVKIVFHGENN